MVKFESHWWKVLGNIAYTKKGTNSKANNKTMNLDVSLYTLWNVHLHSHICFDINLWQSLLQNSWSLCDPLKKPHISRCNIGVRADMDCNRADMVPIHLCPLKLISAPMKPISDWLLFLYHILAKWVKSFNKYIT